MKESDLTESERRLVDLLRSDVGGFADFMALLCGETTARRATDRFEDGCTVGGAARGRQHFAVGKYNRCRQRQNHHRLDQRSGEGGGDWQCPNLPNGANRPRTHANPS